MGYRIFLILCLFAPFLGAIEFTTTPMNIDLSKTNPFYICNEFGQAETMKQISQMPRIANSLHIGWSIEFNYKIISERKTEHALICDVSRKTFLFYTIMKDCMLKYNYDQFLDMLILHIFATEFRPYNEEKFIKNLKKAYSSWLDQEAFDHIKQMYQSGRIQHLQIDLCDESGCFNALSEWIKENDFNLDTLYLSNISDWIGDMRKHLYYDNLFKIIGPNTIYIYASEVVPGKAKIMQYHKIGHL